MTDTPIPFLDLKAQHAPIAAKIAGAIERVVASQVFIMGPEVAAFEEAVAVYSQCDHAIGVSSGTDALLVSLMALDIGPGAEVITTPYSFFATAGCVSRLGATPVFVDIDPDSFNIDAALLAAAVTDRTRAILPVHLFGQMADMAPVMALAERYNLAVVEDAAQALGAEYHGRRAGSIGDVGCFSFYPSKNLGAFGDAGMVVTNSAELAAKLKLLRVHGAAPKYFHKLIGGNFRLDALQAAVLNVKLQYLDDWSRARQAKAACYRQLFADRGLAIDYPEFSAGRSDGIVLPAELPDRRHIYNQFVIWTRRRDELRQFLRERGIATQVYYPLPLHRQECFAYLGYDAGAFPVSELAADSTVALPIYPELDIVAQERVVDAIAAFLAGHD